MLVIFLFLRLPHQIPLCISVVPCMCHMSHPSHAPWFHHLRNIQWGVHTIEFLIMQFSPSSCYFLPHSTNNFFSPLFWKSLSLCASLNTTKFHANIKQHVKSYSCIIWSLYCIYKCEEKILKWKVWSIP